MSSVQSVVEDKLTEIKRRATAAGQAYMTAHPNEKPEGTNKWTKEAVYAASAEFSKLCREIGINPFTLPKS